MLRQLGFVSLAATVLTCAAFAQKPNFTGTWKLNVAKSDFGPLPGPTSQTAVVQHSDPALTMNVSSETDQGKQQNTANYTTDGKEVTNKRGPTEVKSTAVWEGNNLVINSKLQFNGNDVTVKSVWSLSEDGSTLTQNVHLTSPMGEADQKMIFDKQAGGESAASTTPAMPAKTTTSPAATGPRPNLSGTWKLNVAKSDFGPIPGPDSETQTIEQTDAGFKIAVKQAGPQGNRDYVLTVTTDGKEVVNNPGVEMRNTAGWEGAALIINTKMKYQENDIAFKDTITLSDDGKTTTVNRHIISPMGELDQTMVYEKQS